MKINIMEFFKETVTNFSDKTAVIDGSEKITFSELYAYSKSLASVLLNKTNGVIRKPIAVFLPKSINSVVADIGIIYSGNAYMNLDVKTPIARIEAILRRVEPELLIVSAKNKSLLANIWPISKTIVFDELCLDNNEYNDDMLENNLKQLIDTDPLCLINTSGSTGTPKGVVLNHRSFIDFTEWALVTMKFNENEILGSLSPIVFDIYSFELCMMMFKSNTIVLISENLAAFPVRILQLLQENSVTFIFWVPTIMVNIANMGLLEQLKLPDLRTVWFAGEVFPTKQFNIWRHNLPQVKFVNMYGPIEITLDCTYYIVERTFKDDEPLPIGFPCNNTDILILNDENQIADIDKEGELCVRGTSLAMGYYNNPEKTASAFVQNPLNKSYPELIYRTGDIVKLNELGEILFIGRKDSLIKHSGYRIELGEIEHIIINTLKLVNNGCVVYNYKSKEIVLYYESEKELQVSELRKAISSAVPKYMIPTVFCQLPLLPRNANGKIDRLQLKELANGN